MPRVVASIEEFQQLSRNYKQKSQEIQSLATFLRGQINGAIWEGVAASKFKNEWQTHDKNLQQLQQLLDQLSQELQQRGQTLEVLERR